MNIKLFHLVHSERPYKRYYYQHLPKDNCIYRFIFEIKTYLRILIRATNLPFNPKYNTQQFPGERKSKLRMLFESLLWAIKYKEVCNYYFLYGLDLKSRSINDYVAYTEFRVLRNIINFRQRENLRTLYTFNYLALARDKFLFYQYCESLGMPYPKTIALYRGGEISWYNGAKMLFTNIETLLEHEFDGFCKEVTGESGKGAFALKSTDGKLSIFNKEVSVSEVNNRIGNATFIIQEKLKNHPIIDEVYSKSLNTLKLITILNRDGSVEFFDGVMRFGAGGSFVDNASQGGVFVGVSEDGYLQEVGYHEPGIKKNLVVNGIHPDTNVKFGGMKLPFWDDMIKAAKEFHKFFYGIPSIGWDVAFTPDGFVFTETGEDWEIPVYQVTNGGKREQYYRTHGYALDIKLRRL